MLDKLSCLLLRAIYKAAMSYHRQRYPCMHTNHPTIRLNIYLFYHIRLALYTILQMQSLPNLQNYVIWQKMLAKQQLTAYDYIIKDWKRFQTYSIIVLIL